MFLVSVETCPLPDIPKNGSRSQDTFKYGDVITFNCVNGYRLVGEKSIVCLAGGVVNGTAPICQNINECQRDVPCSQDAICTDTQGGFGCQCILGFTGDGFSCSGKDIISCVLRYNGVGEEGNSALLLPPF